MKKITTSIIYGFVLGVAIAIMFLPYKEVQFVNDGEFVEYILLRVYIINVLRVGIGGGIIGAIYYIIVSKKSKWNLYITED